ncbi:MAG: glycine zipper domain-containing protein [Gemmataceae bacterium]
MLRYAIPFVVVAFTGCSTMDHTEKGIVGGGLLGAATGAVIGKATGNTAAGALIGAAAGGTAGGLIGNEIDDSEKKIKQASATAAVPVRGPLSLQEIATMAQQGISDAVIIGQIRSTGSVYTLSPSDISYLKQYNVSDPVVLEMQATATRVPPPRPRVYARPYYGPEVVVVEPCPPPPVGVGFTYIHGRRW